MQSGPSQQSPNEKPRYPLAIGIAMIALVVFVGSAVWATGLLRNQQGENPRTTATGTPATGPTATVNTAPTGSISPLIFGTNLGLFNNNDQVLQSQETRQLMQKLHIKMYRVPVRNEDEVPYSDFLQMMRLVKETGAVPLVILRGVKSPNMIETNTRVVKDVSALFGNTTVYYEFGNEDDYHGVDVNTYIDGWNSVVPELKKLSPTAHFVGPVSWQYNPNYIRPFLQNAKVLPDEISWHEYTCEVKWKQETCLKNIDEWTTHISAARELMAQTIGKVLPIMITEWNYTAGQSIQNNGEPIDDGKYTDKQFVTTWTTKALKTLADNRVFASMQYSVTNTALALITHRQEVTTQGEAFQTLYQQMFPGA